MIARGFALLALALASCVDERLVGTRAAQDAAMFDAAIGVDAACDDDPDEPDEPDDDDDCDERDGATDDDDDFPDL